MKCVECRFWMLQALNAHDGARLGHCRRRSPGVSERGDGKVKTLWSLTREDDFCGQAQAPVSVTG